MLSYRVLIGFTLIVASAVSGNLLLKIGAMQPPAERIFGLLGWKSLVGLILFGVGGLGYAVVLRAVPLNVAQAFTASQFIGVVLGATLILGEPISAVRWLGLLCTAFGILVVALSTSA